MPAPEQFFCSRLAQSSPRDAETSLRRENLSGFISVEKPNDRTNHKKGRCVNNSRLKSKALLSQPKPLDNIRACLHQPLGYQLIAQTLQILTCIDVTVRTVTTVLANKSVLLPATNGTAM